VRRADNLTTFMSRLSGNTQLSARHVGGLLYLPFHYLWCPIYVEELKDFYVLFFKNHTICICKLINAGVNSVRWMLTTMFSYNFQCRHNLLYLTLLTQSVLNLTILTKCFIL
jgi:hypothetical protein